MTIWDLQSKSIINTLRISDSPVLSLDVQGSTLVAMGLNGDVSCYDLSESFNGYDSDRTDTN